MPEHRLFQQDRLCPQSGEIACWSEEAAEGAGVLRRLSLNDAGRAIRSTRFGVRANSGVFAPARRIRPAVHDVEAAPRIFAEENRWAEQEALERFTDLLEQLPEVQRHAFVLFRIEGLSHEEIAGRLGVSVVRSVRHVTAAMRYMARHLGQVAG